MSFFKNLFRSQKPEQALRGSAVEPGTAEQQAIRDRMEVEVARGKEIRAAKAAEAAKEHAD